MSTQIDFGEVSQKYVCYIRYPRVTLENGELSIDIQLMEQFQEKVNSIDLL